MPPDFLVKTIIGFSPNDSLILVNCVSQSLPVAPPEDVGLTTNAVVLFFFAVFFFFSPIDVVFSESVIVDI